MKGLESIAMAVAHLEHGKGPNKTSATNKAGKDADAPQSMGQTANTITNTITNTIARMAANPTPTQVRSSPAAAQAQAASGVAAAAGRHAHDASALFKIRSGNAGDMQIPLASSPMSKRSVDARVAAGAPIPTRRDFASNAARLVSADSLPSDDNDVDDGNMHRLSVPAAATMNIPSSAGFHRSISPSEQLSINHAAATAAAAAASLQHHNNHHLHQRHHSMASAYLGALGHTPSASFWSTAMQLRESAAAAAIARGAAASPAAMHAHQQRSGSPANAFAAVAATGTVSAGIPVHSELRDRSHGSTSGSSSQDLSRHAPVPAPCPSSSPSRPPAAATAAATNAAPVPIVPKAYSSIEDTEELARTVPPPPSPSTVITKVLENDVLCGRGGETNHHPGNVKYRNLVKCYQPLYIVSKRRDKPRIAQKIVLTIRKNGGRFLKKDSATKSWRDVGNTKAREKTSQALREGAPELRNVGKSERRSSTCSGPAQNAKPNAHAAAVAASGTGAGNSGIDTGSAHSSTSAISDAAAMSAPHRPHSSMQEQRAPMHAQMHLNMQQQQHQHHHSLANTAAIAQLASLGQLQHAAGLAPGTASSLLATIIHHQQQQQQQHHAAAPHAAHLYSALARRMSGFAEAQPSVTVVNSSHEEMLHRAAKRHRPNPTQSQAQAGRHAQVPAPAPTIASPASVPSSAATAIPSHVGSTGKPSPVSPTSSYVAGPLSDDGDSTSTTQSATNSPRSSSSSSPRGRGPRLKRLKRRLIEQSEA